METDRLIQLCKKLTEQLPCEFAGLAIYDPPTETIKWTYAWGNRNEKYKRIVVRPGKGVSGNVIRTGTPMIVSSFPHSIIGKATDYPIMLAEHLVSCIAVPIREEQTSWGVLLGGNRNEYLFSQEQEEIIKKIASEVETLLKKRSLEELKSKVRSNDE